MDRNVKMGFPPVFDSGSKVLILGSFPSVKSREISFYYGNKQNRFWKTIFSIFNQPFLESTQERIGFLKEKGIALWDVVESCEIVGSADSSIKNVTLAPLEKIVYLAKIEKVLLNGTLAYKLYEEYFSKKDGFRNIPYIKMPSTSPANPRFTKEIWESELRFLR